MQSGTGTCYAYFRIITQLRNNYSNSKLFEIDNLCTECKQRNILAALITYFMRRVVFPTEENR